MAVAVTAVETKAVAAAVTVTIGAMIMTGTGTTATLSLGLQQSRLLVFRPAALAERRKPALWTQIQTGHSSLGPPRPIY